MKQSPDPARDAGLQLSLPLSDPRRTSPGVLGRASGRRIARIGDRVVDYELRRSRRRSIGLLIDGTGLRVTAPKWATLADIDAVLAEKSRWIERKLVEWHEHAQRRDRLTVRWQLGEQLCYLGRPVTLTAGDVAGRIDLDGDRLLVGLPPHGPQAVVRDAVQGWLKARARELFAQRLPVYTARLGRQPSRWTLSSARTRWGSCAADGSIRLNWRLVHFPLDVVDYVVAHELAHLVHLNHGPRFWATVQSLLPAYEHARRMLRDYPDDLTMS
jgi:predicted metal-dependent hydrolase